jgi:hypothetical protein
MSPNELDATHPIGYPSRADHPNVILIQTGWRRIAWPMRLTILGLAVGLIGVYAIAAWMHPFDQQGQPLKQEAHRQLGLPPCGFYVNTGKPCPACGLTTSFALLMHGEVWASMKANFVGTLMAMLGWVLLPWSIWVSWRGRLVGIDNVERSLMAWGGFFLALLLIRWVIVMVC